MRPVASTAMPSAQRQAEAARRRSHRRRNADTDQHQIGGDRLAIAQPDGAGVRCRRPSRRRRTSRRCARCFAATRSLTGAGKARDSSRWSLSITVTWQPPLAAAQAASRPMTPPPTITMRERAWIWRRKRERIVNVAKILDVESRRLPIAARRRGRVPVASSEAVERKARPSAVDTVRRSASQSITAAPVSIPIRPASASSRGRLDVGDGRVGRLQQGLGQLRTLVGGVRFFADHRDRALEAVRPHALRPPARRPVRLPRSRCHRSFPPRVFRSLMRC